jgi:small GTP-binding protein
MAEAPLQFKFIVIGASGAGKTSIVRRLVDNKFVKTSQSTVGIEYFTHIATVGNRTVKMMIWDTAGQERFYTVAKAYFRSAVGVVLVFDICDRKSFEQLPRWLRDARLEADPHCTVYLVGNKCDLDSQRNVTREEAEDFAKKHELTYMETSAANNTNIAEVFLNIAESLLGKVANGTVSAGTTLGGSSPVIIEQTKKESKPCDC